MSAATKILDRLQRPKRVKEGHWMTACPCCESRKGRPLSVTEKGDGRVLLYAFCGCSTEDVLGRLGLELGDLFDQPIGAVQAGDHRIPSQQVLDALCPEVTVLGVIAADFLSRKEISEHDWERLSAATSRILRARDYVRDR